MGGCRGELEKFDLIPEGFHLGARDLGESGALFAGNAFHFAETAREFCAGFFESDFGIEVEETREIDGDKKDVADFGLDARGIRLALGEDVAEFAGFFKKLGEDAVKVVPVEADAGGFAGELVGLEKSGKGAGDAIEEGFVGIVSRLWRMRL